MKKLSIKKLFAFILLTLSALTAAPALTNAEVQTLEQVACPAEGIYQFQSVNVSAGPRDVQIGKVFRAGENIDFVGYIENNNPFPLVDGNVFARVSRSNPNYISEGHNIISEVFLAENVTVDANSKIPFDFTWRTPTSWPTDTYRIDYFFTVDKRFNMAGLPFTNEIVAGSTEFKIASSAKLTFALDKSTTKFNGGPYQHIGGWPMTAENEAVSIVQPIKNLTAQALTVNVNYEYYFWDSIRKEDLIDKKTETVTIPANGSVDLKYEIAKPNTPVGYLKISASKGNEEAIVNVRFVTPLNKTRINSAGINKFPLMAGDEFKTYVCVHNISGDIENQKILLSVKGEKGDVIASGEVAKTLGSNVVGFVMNNVATSKQRALELVVEVKNKDGQIEDSYSTKYDCSTLKNEACMAMVEVENNKNIVLYSIVSLLILLALIIMLKRIGRKKIETTVISALMLALLASTSFLVSALINKIQPVTAQSVIAGTTKTATQTSTQSYGFVDRTVGTVTLSRNLTAEILSNNSSINLQNLSAGNEFFVKLTGVCSYNLVSGAWDTPYCGESVIYSSGGLEARARMTRMLWTPELVDTESKLTCSKISDSASSGSAQSGATRTATWKCTVKSGVQGATSLELTVGADQSKLHACAQCINCGDPAKDRIRLTETTNILGCSGSGELTPNTIQFGAPNNFTTGLLQAVNRAEMVWPLNVVLTPVNGDCGSANGDTYATKPANNLCRAGNSTTVDQVGNAWKWKCLGINNGSDVDCSARKENNGKVGDAPGQDGSPSACLIIEGNSINSVGEDGPMLGVNVSCSNCSYTWSNNVTALTEDNSKAKLANIPAKPTTIDGITVTVSKGGGAGTLLECSPLVFEDAPLIYVEKPIVSDNVCVVNVDYQYEATCKLYAEGDSTPLLTKTFSGTGDELMTYPTGKPTIKYKAVCSYNAAPEGAATSTKTVESTRTVSCQRKGNLIEN